MNEKRKDPETIHTKNETIHTRNRRRRKATFLNTWFEGSSAHHMERQIIIFIPAQLHQSVKHDLVKGTNMLKINGLAMAWFEGLL